MIAWIRRARQTRTQVDSPGAMQRERDAGLRLAFRVLGAMQLDHTAAFVDYSVRLRPSAADHMAGGGLSDRAHAAVVASVAAGLPWRAGGRQALLGASAAAQPVPGRIPVYAGLQFADFRSDPGENAAGVAAGGDVFPGGIQTG